MDTLTELVNALKNNGFANPTATLNYVLDNTLHDAQYCGDKKMNDDIKVMNRFIEKYGKMTIAQIYAEAAK